MIKNDNLKLQSIKNRRWYFLERIAKVFEVSFTDSAV